MLHSLLYIFCLYSQPEDALTQPKLVVDCGFLIYKRCVRQLIIGVCKFMYWNLPEGTEENP
jgi:hypothetical protein